jgi:hypothetical protein
LLETTCKLFRPDIFDVLHRLMIDKLGHHKAALEFAQHLKVIEIDRGEQVPVRKDCMFMMLQGRVKVTTHWKIADG